MEPYSRPQVTEAGISRADEYRRRNDTAVLAIGFADIAGSTALLESLGEDRFHNLREAYKRKLHEVVEEDGAGCVVQFYGDGALVVFSEPSTAVERCLRLVRDVEQPIRLRVGIDVGQVARKSRSGTVLEVFGRHVNRASRIQSLAEPRHVLTSYAVYDFAVGWLRSAGIEWASLGRLPLKGFRDKISLHEPFFPNVVEPQEPLAGTEEAPICWDDKSIGGANTFDLPRWMRWRWPRRQRVFCLASPSEPFAIEGGENSDMVAFRDVPPDTLEPEENPYDFGYRVLRRSAEKARGSLRRRLFREGGVKAWILALSDKRATAPIVLWVDDHPKNNEFLKQIMESAGYFVENVLDTDQAMARLLDDRFDLVISDMRRGDRRTAGIDLLLQMRKAGIDLPKVVFASARAVAEYGQLAYALGAVECTAGTIQLLAAVAEHTSRSNPKG